MNFLILNGPRCPRAAAYPHYRGTYRAHPTCCEGLPEDSEINKLFFWFLEEGGELGVVHDLSKALRYVELLNAYPLPGYSHFEVVEVTGGDEAPQVGGELLGFDVSSGYNNSLLWWWQPATQPKAIASVEGNGDTSPSATTFPEPVRVLSALIKRFYTLGSIATDSFRHPLLRRSVLGIWTPCNSYAPTFTKEKASRIIFVRPESISSAERAVGRLARKLSRR